MIIAQALRQIECAYRECSDELQQVGREMIEVVLEGDKDEREMALSTIEEALFPSFYEEDQDEETYNV